MDDEQTTMPGVELVPNAYGYCGWTREGFAYLIHCSSAHGGPDSPMLSGRPTIGHPKSGCRCCHGWLDNMQVIYGQ